MMRKPTMSPMILMLLAVALVAAACGGTDDVGGSTTTTTPPTTTTTSIVKDLCDRQPAPGVIHLIDLDDDGASEVVYMDPASGADSFELGLCIDGAADSEITIEGPDSAILGFVDLDDDGRLEILVRSDGERGPLVRAVTVKLSGLTLTDLAAEQWITGGVPNGPFEATGFACDDTDDDGDLELVVIRYQPADGLHDVEPGTVQDQVNLKISLIHLDGMTVAEYGLDMYETDFQTAYGRWREPDRCAPGSAPRVDVVYGENGWGRVDFDLADFASEGDVVLTGIAKGARRAGMSSSGPSSRAT